MSVLLSVIIIILIFENKINGSPLIKNKPYENPELFEGDMLFPDTFSSMDRGVARRGKGVAWPNGIVPYEILPGYGIKQESFIIETMQKMERLIAINNVKCIQFRPKISSDFYYISIVNGKGCSSYVGQNTGIKMNRTVNLQYPGCIDQGRIMHELLHALGFFHEQSRPDRDKYVKINYNNIQAGMEHNFAEYSEQQVDTLNEPYDYSSVMHYEKDAFTKNGLPTIETIPPNIPIGQRYNLSSTDIDEVRIFYKCSSSGTTLPPIPSTTTGNLFVINTTITASLTSKDQKYSRFNGSGSNYYYHKYILSVNVAGYYMLMTDSSIEIYGYIYYPSFNQYNSFSNLIAFDDNDQFKLEMDLEDNFNYILIVTTHYPNSFGSYQLIASGLNKVNLVNIAYRKMNSISMNIFLLFFIYLLK